VCSEREMVPIPDLLADVRARADTAHPEYGHNDNGEVSLALDRCIVPAVKAVWAQGIRTIGCCCGHGSGHGVISIETELVDRTVKKRR
jgi:hypothetical protein